MICRESWVRCIWIKEAEEKVLGQLWGRVRQVRPLSLGCSSPEFLPFSGNSAAGRARCAGTCGARAPAGAGAWPRPLGVPWALCAVPVTARCRCPCAGAQCRSPAVSRSLDVCVPGAAQRSQRHPRGPQGTPGAKSRGVGHGQCPERGQQPGKALAALVCAGGGMGGAGISQLLTPVSVTLTIPAIFGCFW